jgi:uncharacterized protein
MDSRKYHLHNGTTGSALSIRVTPRSSRNEISDILDDGTVKVRLTAAPVEGAANQELVKYLADALGVNTSHIEIVAGLNSRDKLVTITGMDAATLQQKVLLIVSKRRD